MHGFQSYPTKVEDTQLERIHYLKKEFGNKVNYGFQDHISGASLNNLYTSLIAVGFGSKYLEKHITFNRLKKGVDYYSSVEPSSFKKFVRIVKYNAKSILTKSDLSKKEYEYRKETKKMLILNKNKKRASA